MAINSEINEVCMSSRQTTSRERYYFGTIGNLTDTDEDLLRINMQINENLERSYQCTVEVRFLLKSQEYIIPKVLQKSV